jgi:hypothetical protein
LSPFRHFFELFFQLFDEPVDHPAMVLDEMTPGLVAVVLLGFRYT